MILAKVFKANFSQFQSCFPSISSKSCPNVVRPLSFRLFQHLWIVLQKPYSEKLELRNLLLCPGANCKNANCSQIFLHIFLKHIRSKNMCKNIWLQLAFLQLAPGHNNKFLSSNFSEGFWSTKRCWNLSRKEKGRKIFGQHFWDEIEGKQDWNWLKFALKTLAKIKF